MDHIAHIERLQRDITSKDSAIHELKEAMEWRQGDINFASNEVDCRQELIDKHRKIYSPEELKRRADSAANHCLPPGLLVPAMADHILGGLQRIANGELNSLRFGLLEAQEAFSKLAQLQEDSQKALETLEKERLALLRQLQTATRHAKERLDVIKDRACPAEVLETTSPECPQTS